MKCTEYVKQVEDFLLKNEIENNLPLGIIYSLKNGDTSYIKPPFLGVVTDNSDVKLVALMTPPHNLIITGKYNYDVVVQAIKYIKDNNITIPGVIVRKKL